MIIIKQLLNEIMDNKDDNIASIDNHREWRWSDVDHLINMKFIQSGNYFLLNNPPIRIHKIIKGPYILEEPIENHLYTGNKKLDAPIKSNGMDAFNKSRQIKKYQFSSFIKLINFFDKYEQHL